MLRLVSPDGTRLLETNYRSARLLSLRAARPPRFCAFAPVRNSRVVTDVEGAVPEALERMARLGAGARICTVQLPEAVQFLAEQADEETFPFIVWGDFVLSFPARSPSEPRCAECELDLLRRALSGFLPAVESGYALANSSEQVAAGLETIDALLFQRTRPRAHLRKAELLVLDTRSGETLVRAVPIFRCAAHAPAACVHNAYLKPKVTTNQFALPGFAISEASVSDERDIGEGGGVDVDTGRAEVRARFEAMERLTFRSIKRTGSSSRWLDIFEDAEVAGSCASVRRNVGYAAHADAAQARASALFELLERDIVPAAFAERRLRRLRESTLPEPLSARLGRAALQARLFLCVNDCIPTVLAFVCDRNGNGASGTASAPALRSAAESAVLNALGMYVYRRQARALLDCPSAWCWELPVEDPTLADLAVRIDIATERYRPEFMDAPAAFTRRFEETVFASACLSQQAGYSYHHDAVPAAFWDRFSPPAQALLREQGRFISLK